MLGLEVPLQAKSLKMCPCYHISHMVHFSYIYEKQRKPPRRHEGYALSQQRQRAAVGYAARFE